MCMHINTHGLIPWTNSSSAFLHWGNKEVLGLRQKERQWGKKERKSGNKNRERAKIYSLHFARPTRAQASHLSSRVCLSCSSSSSSKQAHCEFHPRGPPASVTPGDTRSLTRTKKRESTRFDSSHFSANRVHWNCLGVATRTFFTSFIRLCGHH